MLMPAITCKEELLKLFEKEIYNERYFYYSGYTYCHGLPTIEARDDYFQWAIVDNNKVIGYFAYHIDAVNDTVDNFGLYSFDDGNIKVIKDVFNKLEELIKIHHRLEWRVIGGNHVKQGYDNFCKRHNGNIVCLHDVTKDLSGNFRDEYIYEIVKD